MGFFRQDPKPTPDKTVGEVEVEPGKITRFVIISPERAVAYAVDEAEREVDRFKTAQLTHAWCVDTLPDLLAQVNAPNNFKIAEDIPEGSKHSWMESNETRLKMAKILWSQGYLITFTSKTPGRMTSFEISLISSHTAIQYPTYEEYTLSRRPHY